LVSNAGVVDSERSSTTTLSTGISFRAAIDAHATATGGRMDQVGVSAAVVVDLEGRDATEKGLLDVSKMVVVAREGRLLEAATLARSNGASEGTVHSDDLSLRVELLDSHLVRMAWRKTETAAKAGFLERVEDLSVTHKVLEFGFGLASQNLLEPSSSSLAHLKLVKASHVRLQGFRATFHLVGLHAGC